MATVQDIVTQALHRARIVPLGRDPKAKESANGLFALQGYYDGLFSYGQFSALKEVYATANYTAGENERIIADNATITIPDTIATDGGLRTPHDLSAIVVVTNTAQTNYIFSNGRWETCSALTLASTAPLSSRDAEGLACSLAMDLAETYGTSVGPRAMEKASRFQSGIMRFADMTFDRQLTVTNSLY